MQQNTAAADTETYTVVRNHEDQYSIWSTATAPPAGWDEVGVTGTRDECLAHIEEVWTDMRPRSVREHLAWLAEQPADAWLVPATELDADGPDLITRLSDDGPVEFVSRPESTTAQFREALERGYVHVRFTGTQGGTELGVELDKAASDWSEADFDAGRGSVTIVGELVLDFEPVRCHATVDVGSLSGQGRLERTSQAT